MPRNVEIKARVRDLARLHKAAAELSKSTGQVLQQEDTFFNCTNGRLKLRVIKDVGEELIYYDRPDEEGPKCSNFIRIHKKAGELSGDMKLLLTQSLGVKGSVKKTRTLYLVDQTRVHVDSVENLGDFMELEVVLTDEQTTEDGQKIAVDLQEKLGIFKEDLLSGAYMDMLQQK